MGMCKGQWTVEGGGCGAVEGRGVHKLRLRWNIKCTTEGWDRAYHCSDLGFYRVPSLTGSEGKSIILTGLSLRNAHQARDLIGRLVLKYKYVIMTAFMMFEPVSSLCRLSCC